MFRKKLELFYREPLGFFSNFVGHDVIDADLQIVQPGVVEFFDAVGGEQVAVGNESGQSGVFANAGDDGIEFRMIRGSPPLRVMTPVRNLPRSSMR